MKCDVTAHTKPLSLAHLLHGGGELQAQLDDSALGGGEVVGAGQRGPEETQCCLVTTWAAGGETETLTC